MPVSLPSFSFRKEWPGLRISASLLLVITLACMLVPLSPEPVGVGLDKSWAYAMSYATANGYAIGSDMVFTFGPYAGLYTKTYHPGTDCLTLLAGLFLFIAYSLLFFQIRAQLKTAWIAGLALAMAAFYALNRFTNFALPDFLFFSYPLFTAALLLQPREEGRRSDARASVLALTLLFLAYGLPPLVKASFLPLCLASQLLVAGALFASGRRLEAGIPVFMPVVGLCLFWVLAGQELSALPAFFRNSLLIIDGYSEAMSLPGRGAEVAAFIAAALLLMGVAASGLNRANLPVKGPVVAVLACFLFMSFKGGFVRHDVHAVIAASSLAMAGFFVLLLSCGRPSIAVFLFAMLVSISIEKDNVQDFSPLGKIGSLYLGSAAGLANRIATPSFYERVHQERLAAISRLLAIPQLPVAADIYSYDQVYLLASGNRWSPRPVFQSYSAYEKPLAEMNARHLLGPSAPGFVVFSVQPIDGRLAALEDGPSWPILLGQYRPVGGGGGYALLQKGPDPVLSRRVLWEGSVPMGSWVSLPPSGQLLWAEMEIAPTILGRATKTFYKSPPLWVVVALSDGSQRTLRLIPGMAASGFLLSPLVENTADFVDLYSGKNGKFIKAILVRDDHGYIRHWSPDVRIRLWRLGQAH